MKELNNNEVFEVSGGFSTSGMVEAGVSGAIGGAGFGAAVGGVIGAIPGAAVVGLMGGGIGFLSGMVSYALASR